MTTPPSPHPSNKVEGPLVWQSESAAKLAEIACEAAKELWDLAVSDDAPQMYEDVRAVASRLLVACPLE
jgi:predicted GTPase